MSNRRRTVYLILGPVVYLLCTLGIPDIVFSTVAAKSAVGTVAWMAFWWITSPVDYAVTAFLPILVNAFLPMIPMDQVIQNYASEIVVLLLGASILTVSWEVISLDKRISARFLTKIGITMQSQVVFWFLLSTCMSMFLPNSIVVATITPIAVAMLRYVGEGDIGNSKIGSIILMSIAWGAGIGGIATPLGGSMNLVTIEYLQKLTTSEFLFVDWVVKFAPITFVLISATLVMLLIIIPKKQKLKGSKEYFIEQYKQFPRMGKTEYICLFLFVISAILAFTRQLYANALPGLKPAYVFLLAGCATFLLVNKDGKRLMAWKTVQKKIIWELIFIFAGGLAAGALINGSGAASDLGNYVSGLQLTGGFGTVLVIVIITTVLSDVTSNTATAAISIPLVISIAQGLNLNPIPYVFIASIGVNVAYTLPTSIRAIPVGYGLQPRYMFAKGLTLTIILIPILAVLGYVLMVYWPYFSVA